MLEQSNFYPLLFEPIFQYRLWGGRRLAGLLSKPMPDGPIGEAWILSDRDDHASRVTNGPLKGQTIRQLMEVFPEAMMGPLASRFSRFPLLLKFLDAREMLSVQVHPSDEHQDLIPAGESAKTEAWVVLETGPKCHIYAGLKTGTTKENLSAAAGSGHVEAHLVGFHPERGDAVFVKAGTVHSLGDDIVVFEIQQNSDVTFRLYDWEHVDPKTGQPRPLQVAQALACIDYQQGEIGPVLPVIESERPVSCERLFQCRPFTLWRKGGDVSFEAGAALMPRVLVCTDGHGLLENRGVNYTVRKGDVVLLPASIGVCRFIPFGSVSLLEIALPE
jgi:mannose-6-phosphate isomerase